MKQCFFRLSAAALIIISLHTSVQAQTAAYTLHTLTAGETLSSLAKEYHTTVGDIMRLNDMHSNSKLQIGEKIKIPATSDPVKRVTEPSGTPAAPPVVTATPAVSNSNEAQTHTVQSGESLYRISKKYNLSVEKLMSLNHLTDGGQIKVGQVLLVSEGTPPQVPAPTKTRTETTPPSTATQQSNNEVQQPASEPKKAPATNSTTANSPAVENTTALTQEPVQKKNTTPVPATTENNNVSQVAQPAFTNNTAAPKQGFFTAQYRQNVEGRSEQTKTGAAMTFKSASGWADKKFYILMNDAPPGSIVKVTNGNTAVYAKVLWSLGAQKENDGLDFRVSTATAAALNITDEKFEVSVTYFQ